MAFTGQHIVVLGGAGFLGSHLSRRLHADGARITVLDNFITGLAENLDDLYGLPRFRLLRADVTDYLHVSGAVDLVLHLASPASPRDYLRWPIQTLKVGSLGTHKALGLAVHKHARFLLASTSEVYGDAQVNPQPEDYWGNVNPVGPRGVYDEAKRFAEALTLAYHREHGLDVRIARIFNTYGPRMRLQDGRAIPEFLSAALRGERLPVHGDGSQTRSLCYVDDMVEGLVRLLHADHAGPVNLGYPREMSVLQLAEAVQDAAGSHPGVRHLPLPEDDPVVRRPNTELAERLLGWKPTVKLEEGLRRTVEWARSTLPF